MAPTTSPPPQVYRYSNQYISQPRHNEATSSRPTYLSGSSYPPDHALHLSPPVPTFFDPAGATLANRVDSFAYSDTSTSAWTSDPCPVAVGMSERIDLGISSWNTETTVHKGAIVLPSVPSFNNPSFSSTMAIQLRGRLISAPAPLTATPPLRRPVPVVSTSNTVALASESGARYPEGVPQDDEDIRSPVAIIEPPSERETGKRVSRVKEKNHGCWMCHKSFDRPSTLKKHLLVHTGEKAHPCKICGRRFGVLSNLNRHVRRCAQKSANKGSSSDSTSDPNSPGNEAAATSVSLTHATTSFIAQPTSMHPTTSISPPQESASPRVNPNMGSRKRPSASDHSPPQSSADADHRPKRRRRAPSPSYWVPDSLRNFILLPYEKSAPVPLNPVKPYEVNPHVREERDSYDENVGAAPYHPRYWKGTLPGPGLVGKDVGNISGGRILAF